MSREWRLLQDDIYDAHLHFAVEEALVRLLDEGRSPPTLRLRRVRRAVFVGVYQDTGAEVDVEYCQQHGIKIVRRLNAGGAVYHDLGSFCFSAFFPRQQFPQPEEELYRLFAVLPIRTCADYGVVAHFSGRNDVLVGERKIYGSAQLGWYDSFVQSGTFLVDIDREVMARALTPSQLKFEGKVAHSVAERVTTLSEEVGRPLEVTAVMGRLAAHAAEVLGVTLVPGELSTAERALAEELLTLKYGTDDWNLGAGRKLGTTVAVRYAGGVVSLSVDLDAGRIVQARIGGDLLLSDPAALAALERALTGCGLAEAPGRVRTALLPAGLREALLGLLEEVQGEEDSARPAGKEP